MPSMSTLTNTFAGVQWLWILEVGSILSCLYLFIHRFSRTKPSLRADLTISLLLAAVWIVFLIRSHASAGAIDVVLAFCLAYVIEALINLIWRTANKSDTKKLQETPDANFH
jgi:Ca2+/Na+ antiporter